MLSKKRLLNKLVTAAIAAVICVSISMTAFAAQLKPTDIVPNKDYVWEVNNDDKMTCANASGNPVSGWARHDDDIYYMDKKGVMRTGWVKAEGKWYYFYDEDYIAEHDLESEVKPGTMATDTTIDNYKVNLDGEMVKQKW